MMQFYEFVLATTGNIPARVLGLAAIASLVGTGVLLARGEWIYSPLAIALFLYLAFGWLFQQGDVGKN